MVKILDMFRSAFTYRINDNKSLEVREGTKAGFKWLTMVDKKKDCIMLIAINSVNTKYKIVRGDISMLTTPKVGIGFESKEELGEPVIIFNPECLNNEEANKLVADNSSLFENRLGKKPTEDIYEGTKPSIIGNYVVEITKNEIRPHIPKVNQLKKEIIESLLALLYNNFLMDLKGNSIYRLNVLFYNDISKKLKIQASYMMKGYIDENYELDWNKGCSGTAFSRSLIYGYKQPIIVDLVEHGMAYGIEKGEPIDNYDEERLADLGHEKYGVHYSSVWHEMKSIISTPILDSSIPLGVLSVDCNERLKNSILINESFKRNLTHISNIIGRLIGE